jgi:peptidoglycan/xylan/chitin deacetylase (PgdA/CDA1 family)
MKKIETIIIALSIALIFLGSNLALADPGDKIKTGSDDLAGSKDKNTVMINLMVDAENTGEHLFKVLGEFEKRGYSTTVYVTGNYAQDYGMTVRQIREHGHDIAFHGWATGENLITMNYSTQHQLLTLSKNSVENYSGKVKGFRPQYYSQNEDTYLILDTLGIKYDSGFISRLKYIPGYENYTKPYKVPNHSFYAVPVSSYNTSTRIVYLCDLSATVKFKLNATEWHSILMNRFNESEEKNEPMVVVLHPWITGNETTGYWQAFTAFLNYTDTRNINIVQTDELLEYYIGNEEKGSEGEGDEQVIDMEVLLPSNQYFRMIRNYVFGG